MFSVCNHVLAVVGSCFLATTLCAQPAPFRVCADPNNLPFSNAQEQGFENKLAKLVAHDLGQPLEFVWTPQRGEFLRKTLDAGTCDAIMGLPSKLDEADTTIPYYHSSYVFVSRNDRKLSIHSFDDPSLRSARIGVQVIGHEGAAVPPAQVLMDEGLGENIVWYRLLPDFSRSNPPSALIEAVEQRRYRCGHRVGTDGRVFRKTRFHSTDDQSCFATESEFDSAGVRYFHGRASWATRLA